SRPDVNDAVKQLSNVQHEYKSCFDINSGVLIEENIITSYGDKIQKSTKKLMDLYMNPDFSAILKTKAVAKSEKENATGYYSDFAVAGDKLFVAAENGLVDIQNEQVTVNADHGQVETVCEFKGDIYAGTRRPGKILRYNGINWAVEKNNLFMVTAIKAVSDTLYAISFKGVFKRQNGQWLKLQRLSKISVRDIFSHKGKLYAMTLTDGLYEITDDDPVQVFTIKQTGYHSELIVETGQVYIKAKSGLLKWTDDGLKRLSDIKVHGEVLTFKEHNGKLFIATTRGIIEHGNSRITDDELVGQIKIFKVFNGQLYAGGTQGVYKLVDNDWQPVGNQMAVGQVDTLTVFKGQLYAGGLYSIAKLQGADWLSKVLYNVNKFIILKDQLYAVAEEQGSIHKVWIESDPAMAKKEFELPEDAEVKNND
ncbi:MAG: hypothetical protein KKE61_10520, partial [Proteobacteria bacterium]|nr:hypothetical protein [Pseudomonadota bacterium]